MRAYWFLEDSVDTTALSDVVDIMMICTYSATRFWKGALRERIRTIIRQVCKELGDGRKIRVRCPCQTSIFSTPADHVDCPFSPPTLPSAAR
jgi:hypothetical protein